MAKQLQPSLHCNRSRGSALVGTLVMVGILALSIGVMISSSNRAIRGSRDKILFEEAYQAALSGTHVARAWIINPELAAASNISGMEDRFESIKELGLEVSDRILWDRERDNTQNLYGTARFSAAAGHVGAPSFVGTTLSDGRMVLYDIGTEAQPVVSFVNDKDNKKFTQNLFNNTSPKGHRNYVRRVRITTPPTDAATSVPLTQTTFVIESYGVAEYAGTKKERVVKQHVLLYPRRPSAPLLSADESIITKKGFTSQASSHANVHWAPVLAKGDIKLAFLTGPKKTVAANGTVSWAIDTLNADKYNAAGVYTSDPNFDPKNVIDKHLRWMAGSNGQLLDGNGASMFKDVKPGIDENGNPVTVEDFFAQVMKNYFNNPENKIAPPSGNTNSNLTLSGRYSDAGTTMKNPNGLYTESDGVYNGSLVQRSDYVDTQVDNFFSTMNYAELKAYAIEHGGYYMYDGAILYDSVGKPVPPTQYPNMVNQVQSGFDPLAITAVPDRMLFVDSVADKNSSEPKNPFTGTFPVPDFWKGVMYIHGDVVKSGSGSSPSIKTRTPEQFKQYRDNGVSDTYTVKNVLLDGILLCNGIAQLGGNAAIYGTLAAQNGVGLGGTPSVFYNSANGEGRMKSDVSQSADFRLIAGRLYE